MSDRDPTQLMNDHLDVMYTSNFLKIWSDKGSGGSRDGRFWRPVAPPGSGFCSVGDVGASDYNNINNKKAVALFKNKDDRNPALAPPTGFAQVWNDKGSGADKDGTFWRPIPPEGFVAMGLVCVGNTRDPPGPEVVMCVRIDLVVGALPGALIWDDRDTGSDDDGGFWAMEPPPAPPGQLYLQPGTFFGAKSHSRPRVSNLLYCIQFQIPELPPPEPLPEPVLHSSSQPPPEVTSVTSKVWLPWFTVQDSGWSQAMQATRSPLYRIERTDRYKLVDGGFVSNATDGTTEKTYEVMEGFSGTEKEEFSKSVGIKIGGGFSNTLSPWSVSAEISTTFSWRTSRSDTWTRQTKSSTKFVAPPWTAVAVFELQSTYVIYRQDGTRIPGDTLSVPLSAVLKQFKITQQP